MKTSKTRRCNYCERPLRLTDEGRAITGRLGSYCGADLNACERIGARLASARRAAEEREHQERLRGGTNAEVR